MVLTVDKSVYVAYITTRYVDERKDKYTYVVVILFSEIWGERYLFVFLILKQLLYVAIKILIHIIYGCTPCFLVRSLLSIF